MVKMAPSDQKTFLWIQKYQIDVHNEWRIWSEIGGASAQTLWSKSPTHRPYSPLFVSVSLCLWSDLACNLSWRWALITDISPERCYCIVGVSAPFIPSVGALGKVTLHITHCLVNQWANLCLTGCVRVFVHESLCVRETCYRVCMHTFKCVIVYETYFWGLSGLISHETSQLQFGFKMKVWWFQFMSISPHKANSTKMGQDIAVVLLFIIVNVIINSPQYLVKLWI